MLKYVNEKKRFTLQDLMTEFGISRRTALRDVASLEAIGAPIYAVYGRGGGYRLLRETRLPPVTFTDREVYAIYAALQGLEGFADVPFRAAYEAIERKFRDAMTAEQRRTAERIRDRVRLFRPAEPLAPAPCLAELAEAIVDGKVLRIAYRGGSRSGARGEDAGGERGARGGTDRLVQPIALYFRDGYWYCQCFDHYRSEYRVFRCDRIVRAEEADAEPLPEAAQLTLADSHTLRRPSERAVTFRCRVDAAGAERFRKELYPSMALAVLPDGAELTGWYEPGEEPFIVRYLCGFGESVLDVEPADLKARMRERYLALAAALGERMQGGGK